MNQQMNRASKIECTSTDGRVFLDISNIYCIESSGNHSYVMKCNSERVFITNSLKELSDRLSPYGFCRIHRQYLVNISKVHKFHHSEGGVLLLDNGSKYPVSKNGKSLFYLMVKEIVI